MRRLLHLASSHRTPATNRMLGFLLAFNAGAVNAGGFLVVGMYTSHMTGIVSMLAGLRPPDEERGESPGWVQRLALLRGDEALPARIEAALHQPPPLSQVLREAQAAGLAAHASVAALVVSDPRDEAGRLFLDYLAARLALPPAMVRGAERRYRR